MTDAGHERLPLPVAALLRRARNAKSAKERHDLAYFAWEASVRLAVAAQPPDVLAPLTLPSVGDWVRAASVDDRKLTDPALRAAHATLQDVGHGRAARAEAVSPRQLVDALPAYRNKAVGHGAVRPSEFYPPAADALLAGLEAAWQAHAFWPAGARLVFVEGVEVAADGTRIGRVLDLTGDTALMEDPRGTPDVPEAIRPGRLYLRAEGAWRPLHPWVAYHEQDLRERVLFFNGLKRSAEYLDFVSGEILKGTALEARLPGLAAAASDLLRTGARAPAAAATSASAAEDGGRLGAYRVLGKLGEGGMGVVYLAVQESLDRRVALKVLPPGLAADDVAVARFRREIDALSRCDHPNVVKVLDSGEDRGTLYYAMEHVEGADLAEVAKALSSERDFDRAVTTAARHVKEAHRELFGNVPVVKAAQPERAARSGRQRVRQLAEVFRDAARGLHHLHEQGVVHRDVKPGNLMVTAEDHRVVVMDLGLAAVEDASRSLTREASSVIGTLRYMAPEQLQVQRLKVDRRADVYSLGATLYELLADRPFLDGDTEARLIHQVMHETPVAASRANPDVPRDLALIVAKATEKDAARRYATAAALADDLDAWLAGRPIAARAPTLGYVARLWVRRRKGLVATVVAAAALVVGLAASYTVQRRAYTAQILDERDSVRALALMQAAREISARPPTALRIAREAVTLRRSPDAEQAVRDVVNGVLEAARLRGHEGAVWSAAFSPDGLRVLTGSADKTARLWDLQGNAVSVFRGHEDHVNAGAFSPDGRSVLTTSDDTTARIWDLQGNTVAVLRGHESVVWSGTFSPGGKSVLTGSRDGTARIWDLQGKPAAILRGHGAGVSAAAFSPDGQRILTGSADSTARLWDLQGNAVAVLDEHEGEVRSAVFSPDGQRILTGSLDKTARIWDLQGNAVAVLRGHEAEVLCATFSPDGQRVLTGSRDRTARICDLQGNAVGSLRGHDERIWSAVFSPDGQRILTGSWDETARIWDVQGIAVAVLRGHQDWVRAAVFSPDGQRVLTSSNDMTARLWDVQADTVTVLRGHEAAILSAVFSPDGQTVLTGSFDTTARIWDLQGNTVAILRGHEQRVWRAVFSPDGQRVLTGSDDMSARIWDLQGNTIAVLHGHENRVWPAVISPDGQRVLTGSLDKTARLWDLEGNTVAVLRGHEAAVRSAVFSPDGRRVLTTSLDKTARIWDLEGNAVSILRGHEGDVSCAAFSPDGRRVLTGSNDKTARIWDLDTNTVVVLRGHEDILSSAVFSLDGQRVLTGSDDMTARIWDLEGNAVAVFRGHDGHVWSAVFSPDGQRVLTGSADGTARIWLVSFDDILAAADERLTRLPGFDEQELERYGPLLSRETIAAARRDLERRKAEAEAAEP